MSSGSFGSGDKSRSDYSRGDSNRASGGQGNGSIGSGDRTSGYGSDSGSGGGACFIGQGTSVGEAFSPEMQESLSSKGWLDSIENAYSSLQSDFEFSSGLVGHVLDGIAPEVQGFWSGAKSFSEKAGIVGTVGFGAINGALHNGWTGLSTGLSQGMVVSMESTIASNLGSYAGIEGATALGAALTGTEIGAEIGSAVPVVGTVVGALAGAAVGYLDARYHISEKIVNGLQQATGAVIDNVESWVGSFFSPVLLDLSNDDFQLIDISDSSAFSDYDSDGYLENTGWVSGADGVLGIDLDGSGLIDNAAEFVFSGQTPEADTDLEALARLYDSNQDGVLDSNDAQWGNFRVWQDWNGDGQSQDGEVKTLDELNITEIGLVSDGNEEDVEGNIIHGRSSFTRADGTTGDVGDVSFEASKFGYRQTDQGIEVGDGDTLIVDGDDNQNIDLADQEYDGIVTGGGDDVLSNSSDKDGYLAGGAGSDTIAGGSGDDWLVGGEGADTIEGGAGHDILFVDGEDQFDGGDGFDVVLAQGDDDLSINLGETHTEAVYGADGNDVLSAGAARDVTVDGGAGDDILTGGTGNDLLSGGEGADLLAGGAGDDTLIVDENDVFNGGEGQDTVVFMGDADLAINITDYQVEVFNSGGGDDVIRTDQAHEAAIDGGEGNDTIFGGWGNDWLSGGHGDDSLLGGYGDDTYLFNRGDGADTIHDYSHNKRTDTIYDLYSDGSKRNVHTQIVDVHENAGNDRIVFGADINPSDVVIGRDGNNLILGIRDGADDDRPISELSDRIVIQNGLDARDAIEGLVFADGSTASIDIQDLTIKYSVLHADAETSVDQSALDSLAASGPKVKPDDSGFAGEELEDEDLSDEEESSSSRDRKALRQTTVSGGQTQAAQAAEVMLLASMGVAAGAAVNPALAAEGQADGENNLPADGTADSPQNGSVGDADLAGGSGSDLLDGRSDVSAAGQDGNDQVGTELPEASGAGGGEGASAAADIPIASSDGIAGDDPANNSGDSSSSLQNIDNSQTDTGKVNSAVASQSADEDTAANSDIQDGNTNFATNPLQDMIQAVTGDGNDNTLIANFEAQYQFVDGKAGHDTLIMNVQADGPFDASLHHVEVIEGSSGADDILASGSDAITVSGNAGADTLSGGDGDDHLRGDQGNDTLYGNAGADKLLGGDGADRLYGGTGNDVMTGNAGDDFVFGEEGNDTLFGGDGDDHLQGNAGQDTLFGNAGLDVLSAGDGDDWLVGGEGADTIDGGAGNDTAFYGAAAAGIALDLASGSGTAGEASGDVITNIESVVGSAFDDVILGDGGDNTLTGGEGADMLDGRSGDDLIIGGAGADTLVGGSGTDTLDYQASGAGVDVDLTSGLGHGGDAEGDVISQFEIVLGSALDDTLRGAAIDELLDGGAGNDFLAGAAGDDDLLGGLGDDTLAGGTGADSLNGGDGFDWASYADASGGVAAHLDLGNGTGGEASGDVYSSIEGLIGSAYDDTLSGDDATNSLLGGAGNDVLDGGAGDDVLAGGDGDDVLKGGLGTDVIDGGLGVDTVDYSGSDASINVDLAAGTGFGGFAEGDTLSAIEKVIGSDFDDVLKGNAGDNVFQAGSGDDTIIGGDGNDTLIVSGDYHDYQLTHGDDGSATLSGTDGTDILQGIETISIGGVTFSGDSDNAPVFFGDKEVASYEDAVTHISKASLLSGFFDIEGDDLDVSQVSGATHGSVSISGDDVVFSPDANYNGHAGFTYTVSDGNGGTSDQYVDLTLEAVNDAPTAYISGNRLVASDVDGDPLTYSIAGTSGGVSASIDGNGNFSYSASGYGTLSFTLRASDPDGAHADQSFSFYRAPPPPPPPHDGGDHYSGGLHDSPGGGLSGDKDSGHPPVVVDLNGNGVEFMGASVSNARFDFDGDGISDQTAWVAPDDGLLVFDKGSDGIVSDASEIELSKYGEVGMTDLEGLAYGFDSNGDGVFDNQDDKWSSFAIWQDVNSDGVSDEGEVRSLDDIGITSIDLARDSNGSVEDGVIVHGYGSFTWADGSHGQLADVAFDAVDETATPVLSDGDSVSIAESAPQESVTVDAVTTEAQPSDAFVSANLLVQAVAADSGGDSIDIASTTAPDPAFEDDDHHLIAVAAG